MSLLLPEQKLVVKEVSKLLHADKRREAAKLFSDWAGLDLKLDSDDPRACNPPLQHLLHWLLDNGAPSEAANLLWKPNLFTAEPQCTRDVWELFDTASFGLIMGAASMSKSYTMAARIFLEWIRDPAYTTVKLIGPGEEHLEANLFSNLVALHNQASLPMPGDVGELFVGLDRRNRVSSISGVVIPKGQNKKAGKIQGAKRVPREDIHPVFGKRTRLFIFIDEIENVPKGVWSDIDNVMANVGEGDVGGLKIFGAYNPTNQGDEVAKRAEPVKGWGAFDIENDYKWVSKRGWSVLRLDAEKSENVIAGREIYSGLQTKEGLDQIARNAGGRHTPGYMAMGRGAYPEIGMLLTVFPAGLLPRMRGEFIWYDAPQPLGGSDLALEGGASAIYTKGLVGKASGIKYPPSLQFPNGRTVMFYGKDGRSVVPRWGLLAETQFVLPKGSTIPMANENISVSRKAGVKPHLFCADKTGHGAGVTDVMKHEWSSAIHAVNYSEGASETRVMMEDTATAKELYDRLASELWYAMKAFAEFGILLLHPQLDLEKLGPQLLQRQSRTAGKKSHVESKKDYMLRGFASPDEADSLSLFVHAARKGLSIIPSMVGQSEGDADDDDGWGDSSAQRIDSSNRSQYLDETVPRYSIL